MKEKEQRRDFIKVKNENAKTPLSFQYDTSLIWFGTTRLYRVLDKVVLQRAVCLRNLPSSDSQKIRLKNTSWPNTSLWGATILVNSLQPNCQNWIHVSEAYWESKFIYLNWTHSLLTKPREMNTFRLSVSSFFQSISLLFVYSSSSLNTVQHNYFNVCFLSYTQTQSCLPESTLRLL